MRKVKVSCTPYSRSPVPMMGMKDERTFETSFNGEPGPARAAFTAQVAGVIFELAAKMVSSAAPEHWTYSFEVDIKQDSSRNDLRDKE